MSELEQFVGRVVDVLRRTNGDTLAVAAGAGATTLTVHDTSDFDETGGQVLYMGDVYDYDTVDHDAATIHLTTPSTVAGAVDDPVDVFNEALGQIDVEYVAHVLLDENDPDDEPLEVTVDHALVPMLAETVRGVATETVTLIRDGDDDLVIWQVDGKLAVDLATEEAAAAAATAADLAMDALTTAELNEAITDGFIDYHYQTTMPWPDGDTTHDNDFGDVWVDTDSSPQQAYRWKNTRTWTLIADGSLVAALFAAQDAQTTADGKIRHYVGTWALPAGPPPADGVAHSYGDIYTKQDEDNREYYWDGNSWEAVIYGDDAITAELIGKIITGAFIRTAASGDRVEIYQDGSGGRIAFYNSAGTLVGAIDPSSTFLQITGPSGVRMELDSNSLDLLDSLSLSVSDSVIVTNTVSAGTLSGGTGSTTGTFTAGGQLHGNTVWSDVDAGGTASGADIGADGKIKRTTSSQRYKTSITPAVVDTSAVLSLTPKRFQRIEEGTEGREYLGLIAEDVEAAGLDDLVFHNGDGLVEGVHYGDALVTALLAVCQTQQSQIDALSARVTALEGT